MNFEVQKFLLDMTIRIIKESNGNGVKKDFSPKNIVSVYRELTIALGFANKQKEKVKRDYL